MTDQTFEFDLDDLTMDSPHEVIRVIRFWEQDTPGIADDTNYDFRMYYTQTVTGIRQIMVAFDSGYCFTFHIYHPTNDPIEAIRQFNTFIEAYLHQATDYALGRS